MVWSRRTYLGAPPQNVKTWIKRHTTLPYDSEVEWLKSDGNQYIDTLISKGAAGTITKWEAKAGYDSTYTQTRKFAAAYNYNSLMYYCEFNTNQWGGVGWSTRYFCTSTLSSNTLYDVSMLLSGKNVTYTVDVNGIIDTTVACPGNQQDIELNDKHFLLFCLTPNSFTGQGIMIGKNKLYKNNKLICDFVPVKKDGVGYMYDRVSRQLFGNQGTGTFTIGPDKA